MVRHSSSRWYGVTCFRAPVPASLAHCVSADMRMGKGIAVEFKKRYGHVEELKEQSKNKQNNWVLNQMVN